MLREYRIDLLLELATMSWRRFGVLVRCLSPGSATVAHVQAAQHIGANRKRGQNVNLVKGSKQTQEAFDGIFKHRPKKVSVTSAAMP